MKKLNWVLVVMAVFGVLGQSLDAMADRYHRPPRYGHHDYGDGFADGLVASTMVVFSIATTADLEKRLAYVGAADEAAVFLQTGDEPSALLRNVLEMERSFLLENGFSEATDMSDETLAEIVMTRAEAL